MNTSQTNNNKVPPWQSARMRNLIEERWTEIWEVVAEREDRSEDLTQYSSDSSRVDS